MKRGRGEKAQLPTEANWDGEANRSNFFVVTEMVSTDGMRTQHKPLLLICVGFPHSEGLDNRPNYCQQSRMRLASELECTV